MHDSISMVNGSPTERKGTRPLESLLRLFSSVWLGVALATLLFLYCSIGSAVVGVRKHFEMTEFQWFHWWPFNVLMVLFSLNMVVATICRISFRLANAGVLMIHGGILILTLGSYYYFGTKVEGDTPVFRRQVAIELPGMAQPVTFVVLPGNTTSVVAGPDRWSFEIQSTNSAWPILSDEHAGEKAYAVSVAVTPPSGQAFVRQLLAGYEQYTEDIIPGKGRAVKAIGRKLVREELKLTLESVPQTVFHVMNTWALFVRRVGTREWLQRPIAGMPRFHDRVNSRDHVSIDPAQRATFSMRPIDLAVEPTSDADPLANASVRITGYLRHARMRRQWREGGHDLYPVLELTVLSGRGAGVSHELIAFDPRHSRLEGGVLQFLWLDSAEAIAQLPRDSRALLHVEVAEDKVSFDVPLTRDLVVGREGPYTRILGTDFHYRVLSMQDNLSMPDGRAVSIAMVGIKTPEGLEFTRMVADTPAMTRDMRGGSDPHSSEATDPTESEPRLVMRYQPASAPILLAAHPDGLHYVFNNSTGESVSKAIELGETITVVPGLALRIDAFWRQGVAVTKPYIVPPAARERNAGVYYSMIRLEIDTSRGLQAKWLNFNQYVFEGPQYAVTGRFSYTPVRFQLDDGSEVEVMFSRERRSLPNPVALEAFDLDTHVGGYSGSAMTIRNYECSLRFQRDGQWTEPKRIAVNHPTGDGGYWFFQSTWDPPPRGNPNGGMNYTGLGVGNRNGVYIQLFGCCLAAVGMIFAFYIKPILARRTAPPSRSEAAGGAAAEEGGGLVQVGQTDGAVSL